MTQESYFLPGQKPSGWLQAGEALEGGELTKLLYQQLVVIAFSDNFSSSIRAIERLLMVPLEDAGSILSKMSDEQLEKILGKLADLSEGIVDYANHFDEGK